jgi:hypothetical protein
MTSSPLGQYAPLVATVSAVLLIGAYVFALLFGHDLNVDAGSLTQLQSVALVAVGAVFGSAVSVNGWKQPLLATSAALDAHTSQISALAATLAMTVPAAASMAASVVTPQAAPTPADAARPPADQVPPP